MNDGASDSRLIRKHKSQSGDWLFDRAVKRGFAFVVVVGIAAQGLGIWRSARLPEPTSLVVQLDQTFEEVVKNSTYPVLKRSNLPSEDPAANGTGFTWVDHPSVIIQYSDPENGFALPPTKFASVMFMGNRVESIATSPMIEALPYDAAVEVLRDLQKEFKTKGWVPWAGDGSDWFDLSPQGKKKLLDDMLQSQLSRSITLGVPRKNLDMIFRLKCVETCEDSPRSLWLIDVGIGHKSLYDWSGE